MANFSERQQNSAVSLYAKYLKLKERVTSVVSLIEVLWFVCAVALTWIFYSSHDVIGHILIMLIGCLLCAFSPVITEVTEDKKDAGFVEGITVFGQFICSILLLIFVIAGAMGKLSSPLIILVIVFSALCTKITVAIKYLALYLSAASLTINFIRYTESDQIFLIPFICALFAVFYTFAVYLTLWIRDELKRIKKKNTNEADT